MILFEGQWLDKEFYGTIAATCTTISFVPQLLHVWKNKSARDVSMKMFLLFSWGLVMWIVYGVMNHSPSVVAANVVTLVISLMIIVLKLRYDRRDRRAAARQKSVQEAVR